MISDETAMMTNTYYIQWDYGVRIKYIIFLNRYLQTFVAIIAMNLLSWKIQGSS